MNLRKHFKRQMVAGIVALVPIVITGLFVWWVIVRTNVVSQALEEKGILAVYFPGQGFVISLIISAAVIYVVGLIVNNYMGRKFVALGEKIIANVPIVKTIYTSVKQVADSIGVSRKGLFEEVVLIEYPKEDIWTVGFVTSVAKGEIQEKIREKVINVFVPTTPNPTSGLLVMVPEEKLIRTKMTMEEGMRLIISGGIATPDTMKS